MGRRKVGLAAIKGRASKLIVIPASYSAILSIRFGVSKISPTGFILSIVRAI